MYAIAAGVEQGPPDTAAVGPASGDTKEVVVPSPWAGCGKGSWALYRRTEGGSVTEYYVVLVDQDADSYTTRVDMVMEGKRGEGTPTKTALRQRVAVGGHEPKVETGEETIVPQKGDLGIKCTWTKTTHPPMKGSPDGFWTKVWTNEGIPGRVVRSESGSGEKTHGVTVLVGHEKK
jgi:hypothetical protein